MALCCLAAGRWVGTVPPTAALPAEPSGSCSEQLLLPRLRLSWGHALPAEMAKHAKLKCHSKN